MSENFSLSRLGSGANRILRGVHQRIDKLKFVGLFKFRLNVCLWLLFIEITLDGVEDAIDELGGLVS